MFIIANILNVYHCDHLENFETTSRSSLEPHITGLDWYWGNMAINIDNGIELLYLRMLSWGAILAFAVNNICMLRNLMCL